MASLTQKEGKTGILSYGLYSLYKNQFKYKLINRNNNNVVESFNQYDTFGSKIKFIDKKSDANVQYSVWLRVCKKFNHMKMQSILNGNIFKMPYGLGSFGIIQRQQRIRFNENNDMIVRNLCIDWDASMKLWKKLYPECITREDFKRMKNKPLCYYTNEHTDGRIFNFHWKKRFISIRNKSAYCFVVALQYKKDLRDIIYKNPNVQYCTNF